jgi:hypothetical protein
VSSTCRAGEERGGEEDAAEVDSRDYFHDAPLAVFDVFKNEGRDRLEKQHRDRL